MTRTLVAGACWAALAILAGCSAIEAVPLIRQLDRMTQAEKADQLTALEAEAISAECQGPGAAPECARIGAIRGRACMKLAHQSASADAACPNAPTRLDCAASGFTLALAGSTLTPVQRTEIRDMRAQALYCSAALADDATAVPRDQEAAREFAALLPPTAERFHLAASAQMDIAERTRLDAATRCRAATQARVLATQGGDLGPPDPMLGRLGVLRSRAGVLLTSLTCRST